MIVCVCRVVSDRQIKAMAEQGATSAEIAATCGAGTGCGACRTQIEQIVSECSRACADCPAAQAEVASAYRTCAKQELGEAA
jgi:bacterioferritin-associated ferredoxin